MKMRVKAIFVVGAARSGSRIYLNMLNMHTNIDMIEEPHILNPRWLHPDFVRSTKRKVKDLRIDKNVDKLVDLMFKGCFYGYFWDSIKLSKEQLKDRIKKTDRSTKEIFAAIMEESRIKNGKQIPGAKYPVHVSFVPTLIGWYPECKIIHIVRDPRAFFASQLYKYAREKSFKQRIKRAFLYLPMLVHAIIQFIWSVKIYERHKNKKNYYLSRYEDIVSDPQNKIKELCGFLEIPFSEKLLEIPVVDSSHKLKSKTISSQSIDLWKKRRPWIVIIFINFCCKKSMKLMNYSP